MLSHSISHYSGVCWGVELAVVFGRGLGEVRVGGGMGTGALLAGVDVFVRYNYYKRVAG